MDDIQKQVIERLKQANNILVTVRNNPTVDLLSACIGLALLLDKMDKHAAAVFSGAIPSTMEFLQPEQTIESTPDSLRDFIIALDKSKADKLRYKVEDTMVRIFITPYKTSLSEKDLEFSQGDFNVDAIVALGAHEQQELDQAITSHGRILHDAVIMSINNSPNGSLGTLNWQDLSASSVSEMVSRLARDMGTSVLDEQIATALLTGIVAETARFSNEKTTPETMNVAGVLMAAGANQQLVASSLQNVTMPSMQVNNPTPAGSASAPPRTDASTLDIDHVGQSSSDTPTFGAQPQTLPAPSASNDSKAEPRRRELLPFPDTPPENSSSPGTNSPMQGTPFATNGSGMAQVPQRPYMSTPPALSANTPFTAMPANEPSDVNPFDIPESEPAAPLISRDQPMLHHDAPLPPPSTASPSSSSLPPLDPLPLQPVAGKSVPLPSVAPVTPPSSPPPSISPAGKTLDELERSVHSPHVEPKTSVDQPGDLNAARIEVENALKQSSPSSQPFEAEAAFNANPLGPELHPHPADPSAPGRPLPATAPFDDTQHIQVDADGNLVQVATAQSSKPSVLPPPNSGMPVSAAPVMPTDPPANPLAPPPGPPPMPPLPPNLGG